MVNCNVYKMLLTFTLYQVRVITVFTVFRLLTDFVCLYNYEFGLSLCKIVRSSVILLLPLLEIDNGGKLKTKLHEKRDAMISLFQ